LLCTCIQLPAAPKHLCNKDLNRGLKLACILKGFCLPYAGAVLVNMDHWRCTVCSFSGKFGAGDTIGKHMRENKQHVQAAIAADALLAKGPKQTGLREAFAKGVQKGVSAYPPNFAPGPADIPFHKLRAHIQFKRCHGFLGEEIIIDGEEVPVGSLKLDLHPGQGLLRLCLVKSNRTLDSYL
jgi:hypothetical protein